MRANGVVVQPQFLDHNPRHVFNGGVGCPKKRPGAHRGQAGACGRRPEMPTPGRAEASILRIGVPVGHMHGVRPQIGARLVEGVVKIRIKMMSLQVHDHEHRRHGGRKLAEGVEEVLRLVRHAFPESLVMHLRGGADSAAVLPGARCSGVVGAARTEFSLAKGLHRRTHVGVVGRAVAFHDALQPRRVGVGPALVDVVSEPQAGDLRISAGAKDGECVDAVEHPAAEAHGLEHQCSRVAARGEFDRDFREGPLLHECDGPGGLHVDDVPETLNPRDRTPVDVVVEHEAVLQHVADVQQDVLRQVPDGEYDERGRLVEHPRVVRLGVRHLGRDFQTPFADPAHPLPDVLHEGIQVQRPVFEHGPERGGIAHVEHVDAIVVGEERLARVETGCGREGSPAG